MRFKTLFVLIVTICYTRVFASFETDVKLINFDQQQSKKIKQALDLIKRVVGSDEFRERILEHKYKGKKEFFNNSGLSNEEIYQKIVDGAEIMNPEKNFRMDIELELYHEKTNTIGYTYPHVVRVWMNKKYFEKYTPVQVADNLFHEWMHKLGFDHDIKHNPDRPFSVPYAIGYLIEELAAKHYEP